MEVWVTGQPHLLYETVELLFAYVNRIPAVELTQEGPYCLPEAAIHGALRRRLGHRLCAPVSGQAKATKKSGTHGGHRRISAHLFGAR